MSGLMEMKIAEACYPDSVELIPFIGCRIEQPGMSLELLVNECSVVERLFSSIPERTDAEILKIVCTSIDLAAPPAFRYSVPLCVDALISRTLVAWMAQTWQRAPYWILVICLNNENVCAQFAIDGQGQILRRGLQVQELIPYTRLAECHPTIQ